MPPKIQFTKADLLRTAFGITRTYGISAMNARAIAKKLGCSTQPIFRAFRGMDEVKNEVMRMAFDWYGLYITRATAHAPKPYLASGMAYIAFAREEAELFKLLFMRDRISEGALIEQNDATLDHVLQLVMNNTGLDYERAQAFHYNLWIFAHGLASMIATRFLTMEAAQAEHLLRDQYRAVRALFGLPPITEDTDAK